MHDNENGNERIQYSWFYNEKMPWKLESYYKFTELWTNNHISQVVFQIKDQIHCQLPGSADFDQIFSPNTKLRALQQLTTHGMWFAYFIRTFYMTSILCLLTLGYTFKCDSVTDSVWDHTMGCFHSKLSPPIVNQTCSLIWLLLGKIKEFHILDFW